MKRARLFLLFNQIFLICLTISLSKGDSDDSAVGNANDYIDEVLENLRNEPSLKSELDPLIIPDVHEPKHAITNGRVLGLSSLYRHGDCTLDFEEETETVFVSAEVAVKNVWVSTNYAYKVWFVWIKGEAEISVSDLAVKLDISGKDGKAKLESFKVTRLGDYKVTKMTGLSKALNWLLKWIVNIVAQKSRGKIINALENEAGKAIGNLLEKYKLPNLSAPTLKTL